MQLAEYDESDCQAQGMNINLYNEHPLYIFIYYLPHFYNNV